ncbi:hypothetical protein ACFPYI_18085 [Halomarina salina]|uniref:Uncharacterized protein n=1 Tax=Halomarina salina TaxID=1872699 RepID=A0ABD5RSW7_9EURY|nr:hypothetical protein [Halomarina salina]
MGDISVSEQDDISTENTMRARAGESRIKLWVLLGANRLFITAVLSAVIFVGFILVSVTLSPPFRVRVVQGDVLGTMFSTMTSALVTGVTLVVSINQLVISQENGPLGDQHSRMSNTLDFRQYASELIGTATPADPSAFLATIVEASEDRAERLRESVDGNDNDQFVDEVNEFVESLTGNADTVQERLDGAAFGTFDVLFAALDYNYSYKVFQVERLRELYGDDIGDETSEVLDELHTSLVMFGPAREHIKTLYFQWALTSLSQMIVYAAIPALLVSGSMLALVDATTFTGTTFGISDVLWVTAGAFTVTLVPFFLFVSYVMRVATVAKRTLAIGPLILRDSQR